MQELVKGRASPFISENLGLGDPSLWKYLSTSNINKVRQPFFYKVILHYDILNQFRINRPHEGYEKDMSLEVLNKTRDITFVTFWASFDVLIKRLKSRKRSLIREFFTSGYSFEKAKYYLSQIKANSMVLKLYQKNPHRVECYYKNWFKHTSKYNFKAHWIVDTSNCSHEMMDIQKWRAYESHGG